MEEVKKDVVSEQDGTGKEKESAKTDEAPKQESGFGKWMHETKAKVNASILEGHIENSYRYAHKTYEVYSYGQGLFGGFPVYGEISDGALVYFGSEEIKEYSVILDDKTGKAYYAGKSEKIEVETEYDHQHYSRPGVRVTLDEHVEEVPVIKADQRYFLYKGPIVEKK